jgi:hypothetical protein
MAIADLTVKKNDGTTDAIYIAKNNAGGDSGMAIWRYDAHAAPYTGLKPEFRFGSKFNGPRTARRLAMQYVYKSYATDSTTGVSSLVGSIPATLTLAIPLNVPQADIDEAVSQFGNLMVNASFKAWVKAGFAP